MTFDPKSAEHRTILRELAVAANRSAPGPWQLQTSNSFRRIGTQWSLDHHGGDGDVICAIKAPSDGHPDLLAKQGVLEYVANADPERTIALLDRVEFLENTLAAIQTAREAEEKQLADARSALEYLRAKIDGYDATFAVAFELAGMKDDA